AYKWPNDLLLNGRKIAGVLLEAETVGSEKLSFVVVGVGVNLIASPQGTEFPATSIMEEGYGQIIPEVMLEEFVTHFRSWFAIWDGADLKGSWRTATEGKRTADEYVVWLDHLLSLEGLARANVDGAVIASVVPDVNFNLVTLCRRYCHTDPLVVGEKGVMLG